MACRSGSVDCELPVEVHPTQIDGNQDTSRFWLPGLSASGTARRWCCRTKTQRPCSRPKRIRAAVRESGPAIRPGRSRQIQLRYGESYDFRVRLMDPTGGGPTGTLPTSSRRAALVYDGRVRCDTSCQRQCASTTCRVDNAFFVADTLSVERPMLGYPAVVFTGKYADPLPLLQAASDASVGKGASALPTPTSPGSGSTWKSVRCGWTISIRYPAESRTSMYYTTHAGFPADFAAPCDDRAAISRHGGAPLRRPRMTRRGFDAGGNRCGGRIAAANGAGDPAHDPSRGDADPVYFAKVRISVSRCSSGCGASRADETDLLAASTRRSAACTCSPIPRRCGTAR